LNPIHEGTNGIQALDLMTRKVWQKNGAGLVLLQQQIQSDFAQASGAASQSLIARVGYYDVGW
jgi:butyryl-CoA dehydrogenase